FQAHMAQWRVDGQPRTIRRSTTYKSCPLPTPEDRLLCILTSLQTSPLQVVQGRLFGMDQSQANPWIHLLFGVLKATLQALGDSPSRSLPELAPRLGVTEVETAALAVPTAELVPPARPAAVAPASAAPSPLLGTMGPNGASSAPKTRLNRRTVLV